MERGPRPSEHVFRAAVSAFSSLSHPTRQEAAQLDDLALGLLESVPPETRRFAAAALRDCDPAPRLLVRRLAEEPVEIAAPLLVHSRAFNDVDLIALIAHHGVPHARAIARRNGLNPVVAALIRALLARAEPEGPAPITDASPTEEPSALEAVRDQLRTLMGDGPGKGAGTPVPASPYLPLRDAALSGDTRRFTEELASALGLRTSRARGLVDGATYSDLLLALRALALSPEQALLLTLAAYPAQVTSPAAIRLFCVRYDALAIEVAREKILDWQEEDGEDEVRRSTVPTG
ncbi:hypothetical protein [Chelativorans sp. AA-79]|uniref:hypothetical protein n=1 Tax=Chelativorans sp. AA-79 TaxID=3028735 RepID=UPI0023F68822|nr:hypothetical protein [Chelativorans sp. AA-79]WEX07743.1 hypothetical protein PVE73_16755 [Chelativorans sp. AA-79]